MPGAPDGPGVGSTSWPGAYQHLLADRLDRRGEPCPDQERPDRQAALHAKRHKTRLDEEYLVAVGAEVIWKTYVRIDALMVEIVKVLSKGITVVRLEDGQRPAFRQLAVQGLQGDRKVVSRQVFEQIAGEREINGAV